MKRVQLVETGIIVVIVVLFYQLIVSLLSVVANLFLTPQMTGLGNDGMVQLMLVLPVLLLFCAIYLLAVYKRRVAQWINGRKNEDVTINLGSSASGLLHVAIIAVSLIMIVNELSDLVYYFVTRTTLGSGRDGIISAVSQPTKLFLYATCTRLGFALLLLVLSRKISTLVRNGDKDTE